MKVDFRTTLLGPDGNPVPNGEVGKDGRPIHHTLGSLTTSLLVQRQADPDDAFKLYDLAKRIHAQVDSDEDDPPLVKLTTKEAALIQDKLREARLPPVVFCPAFALLEVEDSNKERVDEQVEARREAQHSSV